MIWFGSVRLLEYEFYFGGGDFGFGGDGFLGRGGIWGGRFGLFETVVVLIYGFWFVAGWLLFFFCVLIYRI